jgi:Dolichyl-phosphate-mannose-protein mannosyltransferase
MTAPAPRTRWFPWALGAVTVGALALRVVYVLVVRRDFSPGGDAYFYHAGANLLSDGKGFISPFFYYGAHRSVPAAEHPPLYLMFLSITSVLGMKSVVTHMLWSCVVGAGTVALTGLVGRAVGGDRVGIVSAVIAAVYPNMWAPDGMLQAETLAMFLATAAVLLAYRYLQRPTWRRLALVGVVCGLGALARSELILLVAFLVLPLACSKRAGNAVGTALGWAGVATAVAVLVIAPWSIYNARRFVHPILLSAQIDPLLASANCDSTYYGPFRGYFDIRCAQRIYDRAGLTTADDESQEGIVYRREAFKYVGSHASQVPNVVGVRLLRVVGLYQPSRYVHADTLVEGRGIDVSWSALYSFYAAAILAVAGAVVLARRKTVPLYPLLAPVAVVIVTVIVTYASTRFRAVAEPMLAVLAAYALVAAWERIRRGGATTGSGLREEMVGVAGRDRHDRALRVHARSFGDE